RVVAGRTRWRLVALVRTKRRHGRQNWGCCQRGERKLANADDTDSRSDDTWQRLDLRKKWGNWCMQRPVTWRQPRPSDRSYLGMEPNGSKPRLLNIFPTP